MPIPRPVMFLALLPCLCLGARTQTGTQQSGSGLHTLGPLSTSVMVDVVAEFTDRKTRGTGLITDFKVEDFLVYDDGKGVALTNFSRASNVPIALWFVLQCPEGYPPEWHSEFMRGNTQYLRPALKHIGPNDVIGVAHWCDNGKNAVDFPLAHDSEAAVNAIDTLLADKLKNGENRTGEHAMQDTIAMVLDKTREQSPPPKPVLVFLYGDHCEAYAWDTDRVVEKLTASSAMVFGISDGKWKYDPAISFRGRQIKYLVHYYSQETGGNFYSSGDPNNYTAILDYILSQVHGRYTLGFKPAADAAKHNLKVELTKDAKTRYQDVQLHYRKRYIEPSKDAQTP